MAGPCDTAEPDGQWVTFDGGDLACGELLMELVGWLRRVPAGSVVAVIATDLAAPIDIPAWCSLTGHRFLRGGVELDQRPHYLIEVSARARATRPGRPWHLEHPA